MALETSLDRPVPVRVVADALAGWIGRLGTIWVQGQVTQISRRQGLNTVFLTFRDPDAEISITVTCSRQVFDSVSPPVVEGASVVIQARPSYYAARGTISLYATSLHIVGLGELLAQIERRRQLLAAEGLFAAELKRRLPFLPRGIGLITAHNSAAERDVVENARRRWPQVSLHLAYATMQGPRCVPEVIAALAQLDAESEVDVIVIARGGGSVEDLLPFSDEALIRAVAAARTPVVSAIGHEPDTPLLDYVADLRASTPTDAAKRVVPDVVEERQRIDWLRDRARDLIFDLVSGDEVSLLRQRGRRSLTHQLDRAEDDLAHHLARVRALSPLATLQRGYAVLQDEDGHVVSDVAETQAGRSLRATVSTGHLDLRVERTEPTPQEQR